MKTFTYGNHMTASVALDICQGTDDRIFSEDIETVQELLSQKFMLPWNTRIETEFDELFEAY